MKSKPDGGRLGTACLLRTIFGLKTDEVISGRKLYTGIPFVFVSLLIICNLLLHDQIDDEMGRTCGVHGEMRNMHNILVGKMIGISLSEDIDVDAEQY
jgi:hypothetical protein